MAEVQEAFKLVEDAPSRRMIRRTPYVFSSRMTFEEGRWVQGFFAWAKDDKRKLLYRALVMLATLLGYPVPPPAFVETKAPPQKPKNGRPQLDRA